MMSEPAVITLDSYLCRRKVLALVGKVHVYDESGTVVAYSKQKAFKLREDIKIFTDESESTLICQINARQIIDVGATYDVRTPDGAYVGALKRKGLKSILRDEWLILSEGDSQIGSVQEESMGKAIVRRFVPLMNFLLAQTYDVTVKGVPGGTFVRNHNPFVSKLRATLTPGAPPPFDRRLALAAAVLLLIIEGKQES